MSGGLYNNNGADALSSLFVYGGYIKVLIDSLVR